MDKPEDKFLDFNKDNIFENLLQAEDHLKRMTEQTKSSEDMIKALDHIQCVVKHISMAKGEASEAQAHTLKHEPDKYDKYLKLGEMLKGAQQHIISKDSTLFDIIKDVREARGFFEKINPEFDISKCHACETVEKALYPEPSVPRTKKYVVIKQLGMHSPGEEMNLPTNSDTYRLVKDGFVKLEEEILPAKEQIIEKEITPEAFCKMSNNPAKCLDVVKKMEKKEEVDVSKLFKDVQVTASLLETIGRMSSRL